MLPSRPVIFISAVSKELHSARDLVAKTLISLGYDPKWQDIAPTDTGDLLAVLRKWVDQSHAVIQIVGHRYGAAPKVPDPAFSECSYTQYEALYARHKGKPVWYIILDEAHPVDPADPEPDELHQLQADYRIQVRAHGNLYHSSADLLHTENIVLKLRDDLAKLRRRARQWAGFFLILLLMSLGGTGWMVLQQKDTQKEVSVVRQQNTELLTALRALPAAYAQAQQDAPKEDEASHIARAYTGLEKSLKLPPGTLAKELPAFAEMLLLRADTSEIDKANAFFATKNFAAAEAAALCAKDHALAAAGLPVKDAIAALILAGQSATEQIQYKRALEHFRAGAALTSEQRDVLEWADLQNQIGWLLYLDGQYDAQASLMHTVWQACEKAGHQENAISLHSRFLWADALILQGNYTEGVKEQRAVLAIRERVLGPEHHSTLMSRNDLAAALNCQGNHAEAEKEFRAVLDAQERVFGVDHPATLNSRNNLAGTLSVQGKQAESEKEYRALMSVEERILGAEHPYTLVSRAGLANVLLLQGKYVEAAKEYRAVLAIQERVLSPEHPSTLVSRMGVADILHHQGNHEESEKQYRAVLAVRGRVLGPDHPDTLMSRMSLANALHLQGKYAEAEQEHRAVLAIQERLLGRDHPNVYFSCYNLSLCLRAQRKKDEGLKFARQALVGRKKILGDAHPDTKLAKTLVELLEHE